MADEVGISGKLGPLLPTDKMKDSGGKVSNQEIFLKRRKKRQGGNPPADADQEEEILDRAKELPSGKIVDIVI